MVEAVGIGDHEVLTVGLGVPAVGGLGLGSAAVTAVEHDDQRHRARQRQRCRPVEVEGPRLPADGDRLGGRPDRHRLSRRGPAGALPRGRTVPGGASGHHDEQTDHC